MSLVFVLASQAGVQMAEVEPDRIANATTEPEIEITEEMIEAGLEFFYGAVPFCDRPADREETVAALKAAYSAMRAKSRV
jgi:hypothetical protein